MSDRCNVCGVLPASHDGPHDFESTEDYRHREIVTLLQEISDGIEALRAILSTK